MIVISELETFLVGKTIKLIVVGTFSSLEVRFTDGSSIEIWPERSLDNDLDLGYHLAKPPAPKQLGPGAASKEIDQ